MLRPAEDFQSQASAVWSEQREWLRRAAVPGQLVLTGGTSVAGAWTRGDVDLHLRVPAARFAEAVASLRLALAAVHPEIWSPTLATFEVPGPPPTGLAVTPVGSVHDLRFTRSWQLLAADPALIREYNAVKLARADQGESSYEEGKSAFFDRLVNLWATHPKGGLAEPTRAQ